MNLENLLLEKRNLIYHIATKHGAYNVRIFGPVARKEADQDSDVDFLVNMETGRSLCDMGRLLMAIQESPRCKVDVVKEKGLRERIRNSFLKEALPL